MPVPPSSREEEVHEDRSCLNQKCYTAYGTRNAAHRQEKRLEPIAYMPEGKIQLKEPVSVHGTRKKACLLKKAITREEGCNIVWERRRRCARMQCSSAAWRGSTQPARQLPGRDAYTRCLSVLVCPPSAHSRVPLSRPLSVLSCPVPAMPACLPIIQAWVGYLEAGVGWGQRRRMK